MSISAVSTGATYQALSSTSNENSSRGGAMKSVVDGIDSSDADAAKQALAKLQDDRKNAAGAGRAQGAHEAHHHHGHRTQSAGDSAAGNTQGASLTYGASASTAQTTAPGSIIDVTA